MIDQNKLFTDEGLVALREYFDFLPEEERDAFVSRFVSFIASYNV